MRAKQEAEKTAKEEAAKKAVQEAAKKAQEIAQQKAKEQAEMRTKQEAEKTAKEEAAKTAKEEALKLVQEEAERKVQEIAQQKAKEQSEMRAKQEAEKTAKEEALKLVQEEAERKVQEISQQKAKEQAEMRTKQEAEKTAKEEALKLVQEEAERNLQEITQQKAKEQAEMRANQEAEKTQASLHGSSMQVVGVEAVVALLARQRQLRRSPRLSPGKSLVRCSAMGVEASVMTEEEIADEEEWFYLHPAAVELCGARARSAFRRKAAEELPDKKPRFEGIPLPFGVVQLDFSMMGYRDFVPRLYNLCKQLGMKTGKMLPSIGFCSDENQGYCTILITKHFRCFPFNHGYIGGIMALDRHGPHAAHGDDMVIIHAPHVGYDPVNETYGSYRRSQSSKEDYKSTCCGKVAGVCAPYKAAYESALSRLRCLLLPDGSVEILVSKSKTMMLEPEEENKCNAALFLNYDKLFAKCDDGSFSSPVLRRSTSFVYRASDSFAAAYKLAIEDEKAKKVAADIRLEDSDLESGEDGVYTGASSWKFGLPGQSKRLKGWRKLSEPVLKHLLSSEMFYFKTDNLHGEQHRLERVLLPQMPHLLTMPHDIELSGALLCMQSEFDRTMHSVSHDPAYKKKNLLLISGLNIDISPDEGNQEAFPNTMFLPWAAYIQLASGERRVLEQPDIIQLLYAQDTENPDAIDYQQSIQELFDRKRKRVAFFDRASNSVKSAQVL
ncbi:unnamed protein product [Polarella glacialis]|uniref:Limiting CO2-inducible protein B/C beta carbonyic anhydrase domain-containing protein n=1 Tax=Polarella glacialis TaxID=89957 RepID=A0A813J2C9_POLGL|nr:unnamed protein product [Polarella glacialis]